MDLVTRRSTNSRSVTAKQSGDGCRFTLRNRDRGRQVAYREAVSGREKVTTDQIIKRHPFIDAFSAANGRKTPNTTIGPATGLIRPLANWCSRADANGLLMARITSLSITCHDTAKIFACSSLRLRSPLPTTESDKY